MYAAVDTRPIGLLSVTEVLELNAYRERDQEDQCRSGPVTAPYSPITDKIKVSRSSAEHCRRPLQSAVAVGHLNEAVTHAGRWRVELSGEQRHS